MRPDQAPTPRPTPDHATLVSRWHQRLAVALDGPLEDLDPGPARLPAVVAAYLDVQRATTVRPEPGRLLATVLEEDLAALGAVDARRAAADLLGELRAVVALEDAAGRALPAERAALLPPPARAPGAARPCSRWLSRGRRRPVLAAG